MNRFRVPVLAGAIALASVVIACSADIVPRRIMFIAASALNVPLKDPGGVCYDEKHHEILVSDAGNGRIVVFSDLGRPKAAFPHMIDKAGHDPTQGEPKGLSVDTRGNIYIVDRLADYVDVCDYRGRSVQHILIADLLGPGANTGVDTQPNAVTVDQNDTVYIATSNRLYIVDKNRRLIRTIGTRGHGEGQFQAITSLYVDINGQIYVTDGEAIAVQVFSADGKVLLAFGEHSYGFTNFSLPSSITTDRNGVIWVSDTLRHVVSAFKREGRDVKFLDYIGAFGRRPGEFCYPSAIAASLAGRLVVVDRGGRLQCFEQ